MDYDDLLHRYFDGEATPEEYKQLRRAMKQDRGLKEDYKLMKKMEKTYPKIVKSYKPTVAANKEVFENIGLEYRDTGRFFVTGFMFGGLPILLALTLTGVFLAGLGFSAKSSKDSAMKKETQGSPTQICESQTASANLDLVEKSADDKVLYASKDKEENAAGKINNQNIAFNNDLPKVERKLGKNTEEYKLSPITVSEPANTINNLPEQITIIPEDEAIIANRYDGYWKESGGNQKWSLELRHSSAWLSPQPTIDPQSSIFNNFSIAGYYSVTKDIKVGLELRQERFFLDYYKYAGNIEYYYEQQPNITSLGVSGKYYPVKLGFASPFVQAGAGFNQFSFVTRSGIGVEANITNSLGFIVMGDFSRMFYNFNDSWLGTNRFGVHYGLIYKF